MGEKTGKREKMKITLEQIKKLRTRTKAGVMDCREALREAQGKLDLAEKILKKWGVKSASKRAQRETSKGLIETYSHGEMVDTIVFRNYSIKLGYSFSLYLSTIARCTMERSSYSVSGYSNRK